MAQYKVTARIDGSVEVTIQAESKEEARVIAEREIESGEALIKWGDVGIDGTVMMNSLCDLQIEED